MRSNKISWLEYKFAECFWREKICSFPHCPKKFRWKLSVWEAFSVTNQSHSLAEYCFCNVSLGRWCRPDHSPADIIEKELMVSTEAVLSINRACCMRMGLILAVFHPQAVASLVWLIWGWKGVDRKEDLVRGQTPNGFKDIGDLSPFPFGKLLQWFLLALAN